MSGNAVTLRIPHDRPFYGIARLVVGGLAARHDLPLEHLEDLQLALDGVLDNAAYAADEDVVVELAMEAGMVLLRVGPLAADEVQPDLERDGEAIGLRRLLAAVVESASLERREDGAWLRLEKRI